MPLRAAALAGLRFARVDYSRLAVAAVAAVAEGLGNDV